MRNLGELCSRFKAALPLYLGCATGGNHLVLALARHCICDQQRIGIAWRVGRVICRQRAGHGTLHTYLRHNDVTRRRHCDVICRLLADVAFALDFIHSRRLVHGNVTSHAVYIVGPHTVILDE